MTPEEQAAVEEFGRLLVRDVYDQSIDVLHTMISRGLQGNKPDPMQLEYESLDNASAELVRRFMHTAVDQTFAHFLSFFDAHDIPIPFPTDSGSEIDVTHTSDGLAVEPYSESGWIAKFSQYPDGIPPAD